MRESILFFLIAGAIITMALFAAEAQFRAECLAEGGAFINTVCTYPKGH